MRFLLLTAVFAAALVSAAHAQIGTPNSSLPPAVVANPGDFISCSQATGVSGHWTSAKCTWAQGVAAGAAANNLASQASPHLTGTPTTPTAAPGDGSAQISNDAFVQAAATAAQAAYQVALATAKLSSVYVSNQVGNGTVVGSDTNPCNSLSSPCLTWAHAQSLVPSGGTLECNGTFTGLSDVVVAETETLQSVAPGGCTLQASASASTLIEAAIPNGGKLTLSGVKLDASAGAANAILVDLVTGAPTIELDNAVATVGTGAAMTPVAGANFNLTINGLAQKGTGLGPQLVGMGCGLISVTGLVSNLTPAVVTSSGIDNGQGVAFAVDADGPGATTGCTQVSFNGNTTLDTMQAAAAANTSTDVTIKNALVTSFANNNISLSGLPSDQYTECETLNIASSILAPLVVNKINVAHNYFYTNCAAGGKPGPFLGSEGWPETAQITGYQSATTLHVTSVASVIGAAGVIAPGELIAGGDTYMTTSAGGSYTGLNIASNGNWAGTQETVAAPLPTAAGDVSTWQVSVSQTLPSETLFVGTEGMVGPLTAGATPSSPASDGSYGLIESNVSQDLGSDIYHISEGGAGFCGFAQNLTFHANYGSGAYDGFNDKGCHNSHWAANVVLLKAIAQACADLYGDPGLVLDHNDCISPLTSSIGGWHFGQANDWNFTGAPYVSGIVNGNLLYVPVSNGTAAVATGQTVTSPFIASETISSLGTGTGGKGTYNVTVGQNFAVADLVIGGVHYQAQQAGTVLTVNSPYGPNIVSESTNSCKTTCWSAPGSSGQGLTFTGNDYYWLSGTIFSTYGWSISTSGSPFAQVTTNTLAGWQAKEPTAQELDPQLVQYTNLNSTASNLNVHPMSSSAAISGSSPSVTGLNDYSGAPLDPTSPSYGAAQVQISSAPSPPTYTTLLGSQPAVGSNGTTYWMSPNGTMGALDTTGSNSLLASPATGMLYSFGCVDNQKPTPGVGAFSLLDNGTVIATCLVQSTSNGGKANLSGAPINIAVGDKLQEKYCYTGDTTGATCTSYTGTNGTVSTTIQILTP